MSSFPVKALLYRRVNKLDRAGTPDGWLVILATDPNAGFILRHPRKWEVRELIDAADIEPPEGEYPAEPEEETQQDRAMRDAFDAGREHEAARQWRERDR